MRTLAWILALISIFIKVSKTNVDNAILLVMVVNLLQKIVLAVMEVYLNINKFVSVNVQINIGLITVFANNAQIIVNPVIQVLIFAPNVKMVKF